MTQRTKKYQPNAPKRPDMSHRKARNHERVTNGAQSKTHTEKKKVGRQERRHDHAGMVINVARVVVTALAEPIHDVSRGSKGRLRSRNVDTNLHLFDSRFQLACHLRGTLPILRRLGGSRRALVIGCMGRAPG
jgi:hypothetical protein